MTAKEGKDCFQQAEVLHNVETNNEFDATIDEGSSNCWDEVKSKQEEAFRFAIA